LCVPTAADDSPLSATVSAEVRAWMARRGLSQEALAERLGISRQALSARLTGRTQWTVDDLAAAAHALNVPIADLLSAPG
jgi:transcriptional regulator with XRE-family HTH domain